MALMKNKMLEALHAAQEKRESLRDQLNACCGFIQACEMLLEEADKADVLGVCGIPHHLGDPTPDGTALMQKPHLREPGCVDWHADKPEPKESDHVQI